MLLVLFTKLSFIMFMIRPFFLLSDFLVVEDYALSKSTTHLLKVQLIHPLQLWNTSHFNCLPDDVLCKISAI